VSRERSFIRQILDSLPWDCNRHNIGAAFQSQKQGKTP
jgi:hypothetical protein